MGSGLLLVSVTIFVYYTLWVIVLVCIWWIICRQIVKESCKDDVRAFAQHLDPRQSRWCHKYTAALICAFSPDITDRRR